MTIQVVIADDQPLVRGGFQLIIDERDDARTRRGSRRRRTRLALAHELDPDVILMDIRMPKLDGVEATRRLVETGTRARILVLTTFDIDEYVYAAVHAGASGYLHKDVEPAQLVDAIRVVATGNTLFGPAATRHLVERFAHIHNTTPTPGIEQLTDRELEILRLLAEGLSNAEIADRLYLSETTIKTHVSAVLRKLGVRDRVQAVIAAYESGIVQPGG